MLRHHRLHFGSAADQLAHTVNVCVALLQRDGRRQRRANPEIALLQFGQEFQSQPATEQNRQDHQTRRADHHQLTVVHGPAQHRQIKPAQEHHDAGLGFLHVRRQNDRTQRRRHRKGRKQAAGQRIGVGPRHRSEDVAFDAAQREQRQKRRDNDGCRKKDRARHVCGGGQNGMALHAHRRVVGDMALLGF